MRLDELYRLLHQRGLVINIVHRVNGDIVKAFLMSVKAVDDNCGELDADTCEDRPRWLKDDIEGYQGHTYRYNTHLGYLKAVCDILHRLGSSR